MMISIYNIETMVDAWREWQRAKKWSKDYHPAWVRLASQRSRPEVRKTYRKMVLDAYRNKI